MSKQYMFKVVRLQLTLALIALSLSKGSHFLYIDGVRITKIKCSLLRPCEAMEGCNSPTK